MVSKGDRDEWLYKRLLSVEDELVDNSNSDPGTMKTFLDRLLEIQRTATAAIAENKLTARTTSLLRNIASTGSAFVRLASGVQRARTNVERKRQEQLENAMKKLSLGSGIPDVASSDVPAASVELTDSSSPDESCRSTNMRTANTSSLPPHVSRCYEWLMQNLHDPYPPSTFRSRVSKDTGVSQRAICDWFTNARRKIGWTKISERHFRKERALTVDCARVVLLGERSKVDVRRELRDAFLAMKGTAGRLYEDILAPSEAAKHLDDLVIKHATKPCQISPEVPPKAGREQTKETNSRSTSKKVLGKRRASSEECTVSVTIKTGSEERKVKRLRTDLSTDSSDSPCTIISSQPADPPDPLMLSASIGTQQASSKRRRSHDDEHRPTKRCRGLSYNQSSTPPETSEEFDIFGPSSSVPLDNTYDATTDPVAPSPSTSLLTVSDESIGTPSAVLSEDLFAITSLSTDPLWSSDIFGLKDPFELPDITTFIWDDADILPPSFEPISLSTDFSVSHFDGHVDSDASWLSSLGFSLCPESQPGPSAQSTNIQGPESDTGPFPDFFQEFFCSDDNLRFEQTTNLAAEV